MASFLEKEPILPPPEQGVTVRPETLSEKIEKVVPGVKVVPTQFKKQVTDDRGQPLITTPQTKKVVIELPEPEEVLLQESKGKIDDSKTWLARFWLRMIEKARLFGWQIVNLVRPKVEGKSNG
jgi:hypothetical protein